MSGFGYPVTLALTARLCLVVGGGAVAERKVEGLVDAGARVTVVSPWLSRTLLDLAGKRLITRTHPAARCVIARTVQTRAPLHAGRPLTPQLLVHLQRARR